MQVRLDTRLGVAGSDEALRFLELEARRSSGLMHADMAGQGVAATLLKL